MMLVRTSIRLSNNALLIARDNSSQ